MGTFILEQRNRGTGPRSRRLPPNRRIAGDPTETEQWQFGAYRSCDSQIGCSWATNYHAHMVSTLVGLVYGAAKYGLVIRRFHTVGCAVCLVADVNLRARTLYPSGSHSGPRQMEWRKKLTLDGTTHSPRALPGKAYKRSSEFINDFSCFYWFDNHFSCN